jgi:hypothetical protein
MYTKITNPGTGSKGAITPGLMPAAATGSNWIIHNRCATVQVPEPTNPCRADLHPTVAEGPWVEVAEGDVN